MKKLGSVRHSSLKGSYTLESRATGYVLARHSRGNASLSLCVVVGALTSVAQSTIDSVVVCSESSEWFVKSVKIKIVVTNEQIEID